MSGMCKNCQNWQSSDSMWGECIRIDADYPFGKAKASINLPDTTDGDKTAALWTQYDFGCREFDSLRAALARVASRRTANPTEAGR